MHKKVQNFDFWPIFLILSTWMWWIWWILMRWDEMGLYEFIWDEFTWDEFKRLIKLTSQVVANLVRSLVRSLPIKASYSSHQRWAHSWDSYSQLVSLTKLSYFLAHDFANFWSEVRYRKTEKNYRALFSKKIFEWSKF